MASESAGALDSTYSRPSLPADPGNVRTLSVSQRRAVLGRAAQDLTRECRASLRSRSDFEAFLVRGEPVNHRLHLAGVLVMAALALMVSGLGVVPLEWASLVPGGYAAYWLFLALTGGEELDRIWVDERGKLNCSKSGLCVETRSDCLRVGIPALVIAVSGAIAVWLTYMLLFPPFPQCNMGDPYSLPYGCYVFVGISGSWAGTTPLSVADTQRLESIMRGWALLLDLAFLLPAIWFLWRMLTGRRVLMVRPIHRHQRGTEAADAPSR